MFDFTLKFEIIRKFGTIDWNNFDESCDVREASNVFYKIVLGIIYIYIN